MKLYKLIPALVVALCIGTSTARVGRLTVYEQKTKNFIQRRGGIDEKLLNSIQNPSIKKYLTKNIRFYEKVEYIEQNTEYRMLDPNYLWLSDHQGIFDYNYSMILGVKSGMLKSARYEKLRELLSTTDKIYNKETDELEKIILLHDFLSKKFKYHSYFYSKFRSIPLDTLLEIGNGKGDCNDLTTAYASIFKFYGIDCSPAVSMIDGSGHLRLRINLKNGYSFDLEPQYKKFVPLESIL